MADEKFSSYQKKVVAILAFLQFSIVLDFMILSPLGAVLMPALKITPSQFGLVVSCYAFSAGASGLLAAGFADRFDRKKLLLFFYSGFIVGTLFCGIATSYKTLLLARMVSGFFGGVVGSVVMAITTDLFPLQMRGRVMGVIQTSFAASSVLGIPIGLMISNKWGWNSPFIMIVGVCTIVGGLIFTQLKPVNAHLLKQPDRSPFHHLVHTISIPKYLLGFAATGLLSVGGFMLMPFVSAFNVNNVGVAITQLPFIYVVTGLFSVLSGPLIGRMSDRFGKFRLFTFGCMVTIPMVLIYTHLGPNPLWLLITVMVIMQIGIFSRMIPASALTSALPDPTDRGSYMSVSSSLQQVAGGVASALAGFIVIQTDGGKLEHFDSLGYFMVFFTLLCLILMYFIDKKVAVNKANPMPLYHR
jgi:predicted MFS family arabinose efflux permease